LGIIFIFIFNHGSLAAIFFYGSFLYPAALLFTYYLTRLIKDFRKLLAIFICLVILQFMVIKS